MEPARRYVVANGAKYFKEDGVEDGLKAAHRLRRMRIKIEPESAASRRSLMILMKAVSVL